jgi:hypothetical protein
MANPEENSVAVLCSSVFVRVIDALTRVLTTFAMGIYVVGTILVAVDWGLEVIPALLRDKMRECEERHGGGA